MKRAFGTALLLFGCAGATSGPPAPPVKPAPAASVAVRPASPSQAPVESEPSPARGPADELFLASISVGLSESLPPDTLTLKASRYQGADYGELSARGLVSDRAPDGTIRVRLADAYVASKAAVSPRERTCSFVLDCEEPVFSELRLEFEQAYPGAKALPPDVVRFVDQYIENKRFGRLFDIASVVARRREGDCTEHAVLLASTFRLLGIPSHVVNGLAIFAQNGVPRAFGHAWTEYFDGERWLLADASNPPEVVASFRYVPIQLMTAEGPDYAREALSGFHLVNIEHVEVPKGFARELSTK